MTDTNALPPAARRKYESLQARLADAHALLASISERRKTYETRLATARMALASLGKPGRRDEVKAKACEAEIAEVERDIDWLNADRAKRAAERDAAERILAPLRTFLTSLWQAPDPYRAGGTMLRSVTAHCELQKDESVVQAVWRVRAEISGIRNELARLKTAPLTAEELREKITSEVDRLAVAGMPQINLQTGALRFVDEAEAHTHGAPSGSAHAIACWLHRDLIVEALTAGLDQEIEGSIPAAERPAREAALRAELLRLERVEVALIDRSDGSAHYRSDCSACAILGIEAAPAMEQAA